MKKVVLSLLVLGQLGMANDYRMGSKVRNFGWVNGSGWEGVIVDKSGDDYKVKITRVKINAGMFTTQINAQDCTGNEAMTIYDEGSTRWIPSDCFR